MKKILVLIVISALCVFVLAQLQAAGWRIALPANWFVTTTSSEQVTNGLTVVMDAVAATASAVQTMQAQPVPAQGQPGQFVDGRALQATMDAAQYATSTPTRAAGSPARLIQSGNEALQRALRALADCRLRQASEWPDGPTCETEAQFVAQRAAALRALQAAAINASSEK